MVNGASLSNCPTALRLYGPTEFVQLFEVTGFVGRVRRQPPPGKTRTPYAQPACHGSQVLFRRAPRMVNGASLSNCPTALRLCGPTEFVQIF